MRVRESAAMGRAVCAAIPLGMILLLVFACGEEPPERRGGPASDWPVYAGDPGGRRWSPLDEITRENVRFLEPAWIYHTGDLRGDAAERRRLSFQATPILVGGTLYLCTPRSRVVALDPETGTERWVHEPPEDRPGRCRGVAAWRDPDAPAGAPCAERIFVATFGADLIALDARSGERCPDFGDRGVVELWRGVPLLRERDEYRVTSPPTVVGDVVIVGSAVSEGPRLDMPSGMVRGFDASSGARLWSWDPIPRDPEDPARSTWAGDSADRVGGANVWSIASADPERDLVFLPTSSPSGDWYGGRRLGDNRHADSTVALRASTGERVWAFQTVHHNLWDYDVSAQPVLIDLEQDGEAVPAVVQATKMGHLFFLHRETGEPLFPVEERPVPPSDVPGEAASPTQPFPSWPPPLVPQGLTPDDAWGLTPVDRGWCRDLIRSLRSEGVFTPPSLEGSIIFPGTAGGVNWGSVAFDPERRLLVANTTRIANTVQLVPREEAAFPLDRSKGDGRWEMEGTPYVARFGVLLSPVLGVPCNPPPWGALAALDLETKELAWEVPLGTIRDLAPVPLPVRLGVPGMGGPLVTRGGLVFIGAALDNYLRAFDVETGEELWSARLPGGGQATPMTYRSRENGRQYVVIAAGGHGFMGSRLDDSLVAFALP
jgi:quinoprotein glucose dehydrogenase